MAFMADLMGSICQTSPGTFSESVESCSQVALAGVQTSFQRGKLTLFPNPIILYEVLLIYVKGGVSYLLQHLQKKMTQTFCFCLFVCLNPFHLFV